MKIVTIGAAMRDLFLQYKNPESISLEIEGLSVSCILLEEGKKIELDAIRRATGGGATNAACSFAKQGFQVTSFFKVGNDPEGAEIVAALKQRQINTTFIAYSETAPTGCSFIIPAQSGNSAILVYRGANLTLTHNEIPYQAITACDQLYVTSLSRQTAQLLPLITAYARKAKKRVAVNPGTSQLTAHVETLNTALPDIDILIMNCFESSLLMSHLTRAHQSSPKKVREEELPDLLAAPIVHGTICFTLRQYFKEILKRGPQIVVVTNGADGVYVCNGTQIYYHPSLPGEPQSTVGAGDAFGSAFVGQLLHGASLENALRAGMINSYEVIQQLDATTGLRTQQELTRRVQELDQTLLQVFQT